MQILSKNTRVALQAMSKQKPASKEACLLTGKLYPLDAFKFSTKVLTEILAFLEPPLVFYPSCSWHASPVA
jgi:hypothetical protein